MQDNPLRIFTSEQLKIISLSNLNELKKEIMLEFQFSADSQAEINGHFVDKNTVLLIFEELEARLQPYLEIEKNLKLKAFFQNGNLEFLKDEAANKSLSEIIRVYESIGLIVAKILAEIVKKECQLHTLKSIRKISIWNAFQVLFSSKNKVEVKNHTIQFQNIKRIKEFSKNLSTTNNQVAFDLAYSYLKNRIEKSKFIVTQCLREDGSIRFINGLETYFNMGFIDLFDALPDHFDGLANKYAHYCNTIFVKPWMNSRLANMGIYQLGIISAAAATVAKKYPSIEIDKFHVQVKNKYRSSARYTAYFILFILLIFSIGMILIIINK